jgi:predicted nucleotidyltransferase
MNIVDSLIFGSECGNVSLLQDIVDTMETAEFFRLLMFYLSQGHSFAKCRYLALEKIIGAATASTINLPNNILAIEYLKWLKRIDSKIRPITIKRKDTQHDSSRTTESFSSASNLRDMIEQGCNVDKWESFVPPQAFKIYSDEFKNNIAPSLESIGERAMLAMLRSLNIQDIRSVADISEGIEHRIMKSIQVSYYM